MTLRSRQILSERLESDGFRISVMSRHTQNDGITTNELITSDKYDIHMPELAPPSKLVGAWHRGELGIQNVNNFEEKFAPKYLEYLDTKHDIIVKLAEKALSENVTLLCIEPEPEIGELILCHRRLIVEACKLTIPELDIDIN